MALSDGDVQKQVKSISIEVFTNFLGASILSYFCILFYIVAWMKYFLTKFYSYCPSFQCFKHLQFSVNNKFD